MLETPFMKPATQGGFRWLLPPPVVGLSWIVCWGVVDWLTSPEISLSAFYLPAIVGVAWFSGRWPAVAIATCGAMTWLIAEMAGSVIYSNVLIPYWNATIRLTFFLITAVLTSEVQSRRKVEVELQKQRGILKSILDSMGDGVLVVGADGKIIACNPAAERIFGSSSLGYDPNRWLREVENSMAPSNSDASDANGTSEDSANGKLSGNSEISLQRPGQSEMLRLDLTALPLIGDNRGRFGSVVVIRDMTTLRELEKQISQVIEREQRRIGQDLHDGVCQHLVGVAFAAGTLQTNLENRGLDKPAEAAEQIASLINDAIGQARSLAHGLYPVGLEDGLGTALGALADTTRERFGISCSFHPDGPDLKLDSVSSVHLYRIAQESVTNAIRHAAAKTILITLVVRNQSFELSISDDGRGMNPSSANGGGIGHHIMRNRANLIGGKLNVQSTPEQGTRVVCSAPIISSNADPSDTNG